MRLPDIVRRLVTTYGLQPYDINNARARRAAELLVEKNEGFFIPSAKQKKIAVVAFVNQTVSLRQLDHGLKPENTTIRPGGKLNSNHQRARAARS